jgi:hypothetical protein
MGDPLAAAVRTRGSGVFYIRHVEVDGELLMTILAKIDVVGHGILRAT